MQVLTPEQWAAELAVATATIDARAAIHVHSVADDVARSAQAAAPVLTGALRDSIEVDREGLAAEVGSSLDYAVFVEYGTWKDAPQPFLGPALDQEEPELLLRLQAEASNI